MAYRMFIKFTLQGRPTVEHPNFNTYSFYLDENLSKCYRKLTMWNHFPLHKFQIRMKSCYLYMYYCLPVSLTRIVAWVVFHSRKILKIQIKLYQIDYRYLCRGSNLTIGEIADMRWPNQGNVFSICI